MRDLLRRLTRRRTPEPAMPVFPWPVDQATATWPEPYRHARATEAFDRLVGGS